MKRLATVYYFLYKKCVYDFYWSVEVSKNYQFHEYPKLSHAFAAKRGPTKGNRVGQVDEDNTSKFPGPNTRKWFYVEPSSDERYFGPSH